MSLQRVSGYWKCIFKATVRYHTSVPVFLAPLPQFFHISGELFALLLAGTFWGNTSGSAIKKCKTAIWKDFILEIHKKKDTQRRERRGGEKSWQQRKKGKSSILNSTEMRLLRRIEKTQEEETRLGIQHLKIFEKNNIGRITKMRTWKDEVSRSSGQFGPSRPEDPTPDRSTS